MAKNNCIYIRWMGRTFALGLLALCLSGPAHANTVCAVVKMVIDQELTLEREAFEGRLRIENGLSSLSDLSITLQFRDVHGSAVKTISLGQSPDSQAGNIFFFHRVSESSTDLSSTINPEDASTAYVAETLPGGISDFKFLIIPAPDSGGEHPSGIEYLIGATVRYTNLGREEVIDVAPATIRVKPMPRLGLDYFLPYHVYGDEPLTPTIEPLIPFSLGVRVRNYGAGHAYNLKIESGQPRITENEQGLPITFRILSSEVNGLAYNPSLLIDFGDILAGQPKLARWMMTSTFSGKFTLVNVSVSHADELGGSVTSLIANDQVRVHTLLGDVLHDGIGHDHIRDFLASASMGENVLGQGRAINATDPLFLYRSNANDPVPVHHLDATTGGVTFSGNNLSVSTSGVPAGVTPIYVRISDPRKGTMGVKRVVRTNDGKLLPSENVWLTTTRDTPASGGGTEVRYDLHLFDELKQGSTTVENPVYAIEFASPSSLTGAPVLATLGTVFARAGESLSVTISATDPDGDPLVLSHGLLPYGAHFIPNPPPPAGGPYTGIFSWTPGADYAGQSYAIEFLASDLSRNDRKTLRIVVSDAEIDPLQAWLDAHGLTEILADNDNDGYSNLLEYGLGMGPGVMSVAGAPQIQIIEVGGERFLALEFTERTADPGLTFQAYHADSWHLNKSDWSAPLLREVSTDQVGVPAGFERVHWRDPSPLTSAPDRRYLALKIEWTNPDPEGQPALATDFTSARAMHRLPLVGRSDNYLTIPILRTPVAIFSVAAHPDAHSVSVAKTLLQDEYSPSASTGPYVLEVISGAAQGRHLPIIGNSDRRIHLDSGDLTLGTEGLGIVAGDRFMIRPQHQVADLLGETWAPVSEAAFESAFLSGDALMLFDHQSGRMDRPSDTTVQLISTDLGPEWVVKETQDSLGNLQRGLAHGQPFIVRRERAEDGSIYLLGDPSVFDWRLDVPASGGSMQDILLGFAVAEPIALADSHLANSLIAASSSPLVSGDRILVFDSSRSGFFLPPETVLLFQGGQNGEPGHWVEATTGANKDDFDLIPGRTYVLRRLEDSPAATWQLPPPAVP